VLQARVGPRPIREGLELSPIREGLELSPAPPCPRADAGRRQSMGWGAPAAAGAPGVMASPSLCRLSAAALSPPAAACLNSATPRATSLGTPWTPFGIWMVSYAFRGEGWGGDSGTTRTTDGREGRGQGGATELSFSTFNLFSAAQDAADATRARRRDAPPHRCVSRVLGYVDRKEAGVRLGQGSVSPR